MRDVPHISTKRTILFVDDSESVLQTFRLSAFFFQEYQLLFAPSANEALELMDRNPVDVIVSDFRMPQMDGAELLKIVADRHPRILRILHSGTMDQNEISRAMAKAHFFAAKPCDLRHLKNAIDQHLRTDTFAATDTDCFSV